MKKQDLCKQYFSLSTSSEISSFYYRESLLFQHNHNAAHPASRLWRHALVKRVFRFFLQGTLCLVQVELVRFLDVNSRKTFTFYGSLFLPYTSYARSVISSAITSPRGDAAFLVSADTLRRWTASFPSTDNTSDHQPSPSASSPPGL